MNREMMNQLKEILADSKLDQKQIRHVFHQEEVLDNVQKEITLFLSKLLSGRVTYELTNETRKQLRMADEYESISDYINNVLKLYIRLRKDDLDLSEAGRKEILELHDQVNDYIILITQAIEEENADILSRAHTYSEAITHLVKDFRGRHQERLREEKVLPLKSLTFMDMLTAYRRMKDHSLNIAEALAGEK